MASDDARPNQVTLTLLIPFFMPFVSVSFTPGLKSDDINQIPAELLSIK